MYIEKARPGGSAFLHLEAAGRDLPLGCGELSDGECAVIAGESL